MSRLKREEVETTTGLVLAVAILMVTFDVLNGMFGKLSRNPRRGPQLAFGESGWRTALGLCTGRYDHENRYPALNRGPGVRRS